jgi:hypothetical protein
MEGGGALHAAVNMINDEMLQEISRLYPPNCDCVHEECGEITRELIEARRQLRQLAALGVVACDQDVQPEDCAPSETKPRSS